MPKLTDSQLVMLSAAAQREDGTILPLPKSIKLNKGAAALVLKSLVRQGLVAERPASPEDEAWREADGKRLALAITETGVAAIGAEPTKPARTKPTKAAADVDTKQKPRPPRPVASKPAGSKEKPSAKDKARAGTKQSLLLELLRRKGGATIEEMVKATGWQPHSCRGAISGLIKRKLGLPVTAEAVAGRGRVYRIAAR